MRTKSALEHHQGGGNRRASQDRLRERNVREESQRKREREDLERDLREGLITAEEAREVFELETEART